MNTCYYNNPQYAQCSHLGLPSNPTNITVSSLIIGSITISWTISDPSYSYTVIWTNLNSGAMKSFTVPQSSSSYTVTGLSDNDNYAVSIATVDVCGMTSTSDPIYCYMWYELK